MRYKSHLPNFRKHHVDAYAKSEIITSQPIYFHFSLGEKYSPY